MRARPTIMVPALLFLVGFCAAQHSASAADHLDAPGLTPPGGDPALDITDIYAFRGPDCPDCTVLIMGVNGLSAPGVNAAFAHNRDYLFRIDTDGDARQDLSFQLRFGRQRKDGSQRFEVKMFRRGQRPPARVVRMTEGVTSPIGSEPFVVHGERGIRAFAGMTDDPFFFDLPGFLAVDFCPTDPVSDTFAGTNVGAIALEVPDSVWRDQDGSAIGVWALTRRGRHQIERMGRPAINTVFIPTNPFEPNEASLKNDFNESTPDTDRQRFRSEVLDTLEIFYGQGSADAAGLADFLLPDILTIDLEQPSGFPNGRMLVDDVIDIELGLVTNGAVTTDCVDTNDVSFRDRFPYLASAHE